MTEYDYDQVYDYSQVIKGTLSWCNDMRVERGMEPLEDLPKGQRGDPKSCPCGEATGLLVRIAVYDEPDGRGVYHYGGTLPEPVQLFTQHFDGGYLPQYDIQPPEEEVT